MTPSFHPWQEEQLQQKLRSRFFKNAGLARRRGKIDGKKSLLPHTLALSDVLNKAKDVKMDAMITAAAMAIERHLQHDPQLVVGMVKAALKNAPIQSDVEIKVHPKDAVILQTFKKEIALHLAHGAITILGDEGLGRGSIIINANKSIIDAQIDTQLSKAKEVLRNKLDTCVPWPN